MLSSLPTQWLSVLEIRRRSWIFGGLLALWLVLAIAPALLPQRDWIVDLGLQLQLNGIRLCVVLELLIFVTAWHALARQRRLDCTMMALTFLCAACLDFLFLTRLPGTPTFLPRTNPEAAMCFWIAARMVGGVGVFLALCVPGNLTIGPRSAKRILAAAIALLCLFSTAVLVDGSGPAQPQSRARPLPPAVGNASLILALAAGLLSGVKAQRERISREAAACSRGAHGGASYRRRRRK